MDDSTKRLNSVTSVQSAALRLSDDIRQLIDPFKDVLEQAKQQGMRATKDAVDDIDLLRKQLQRITSTHHAVEANKATDPDGAGKATNPSADALITLARFVPAAAKAMRATNVQYRLLREKEAAHRTAVTTVAEVEEKCFESCEADALQRLKSTCDAAQKLENDVSAFAFVDTINKGDSDQ